MGNKNLRSIPFDRGETVVKRYLRDHGVTIIGLAAALSMDRVHLSSVINGWATPATVRRWAPRIAAALGVPVPTLFPDLEERTK